jgi:pyruvate ferredoxin oxidoreductase beta subunit
MASLKELSKIADRFTGGHRGCAGCTEPIAVRQVLLAAGDFPVVTGSCTGCLEVISTIFPYTAWKCSFFHSAFENSAATMSGIETGYRALVKRGRIKESGMKFIAFGGDGGTYDIGFQSLSGAMERGHNMLYVCLDNGAYMNTGIQRSSATPKGAHTTTSPAGKVIPGKTQFRKDLTSIMVAHNIPYVAQTHPGNWRDLTSKVKKALSIEGPTFINILVPCRLGWGFAPELALEIAREAVECCYWPLFEVEEGNYKLNYKPKEKKPIVDWLKKQARFKHLFKPGLENILEDIQKDIDKNWERLLSKCNIEN